MYSLHKISKNNYLNMGGSLVAWFWLWHIYLGRKKIQCKPVYREVFVYRSLLPALNNTVLTTKNFRLCSMYCIFASINCSSTHNIFQDGVINKVQRCNLSLSRQERCWWRSFGAWHRVKSWVHTNVSKEYNVLILLGLRQVVLEGEIIAKTLSVNRIEQAFKLCRVFQEHPVFQLELSARTPCIHTKGFRTCNISIC